MQWERRQRPQPASLSLFEWAVGPEEVREEELVGTSRLLKKGFYGRETTW